MTRRQISVEISKLLREAVKENILDEVYQDISKMCDQAHPDYVPDAYFDEGIDIVNRPVTV